MHTKLVEGGDAECVARGVAYACAECVQYDSNEYRQRKEAQEGHIKIMLVMIDAAFVRG